MKLLVIGSGHDGFSDRLRYGRQDHVRFCHSRRQRSQNAPRKSRSASTIITGGKKVHAAGLDACKEKEAARLMKGHDGALSAVPYFLNLGLAKAAISAVAICRSRRQQHGGAAGNWRSPSKPRNAAVAIAPDCGLSPGMASISRRRTGSPLDGRADALKLYVGGLPENPMPPFNYQLVFSVEGLIQRIRGTGAHSAQRQIDHHRSAHRAGTISTWTASRRWWRFKPPAEPPLCQKLSRAKLASASRKRCAIPGTTICSAN